MGRQKRTQRIEQRGRVFFELNGELLSQREFVDTAESDGFLCVVKRNEDGTLKKPGNPKRNKSGHTESQHGYDKNAPLPTQR
jgi:hypothetical protein